MNEKKRAFLKWLSYVLLLCVIFVFQTAKPSSFSINGYINLFPFFIAAAAVFETPFNAAVIGFITGMLADSASTPPDGLLMFYYTLSGCLTSFIAQRYFRRAMRVCFIFGGLILFFQHFAGFVFYYALALHISTAQAAVTVLRELFVSLIASSVVYLVVKKIYKTFTLKGED